MSTLDKVILTEGDNAVVSSDMVVPEYLTFIHLYLTLRDALKIEKKVWNFPPFFIKLVGKDLICPHF